MEQIERFLLLDFLELLEHDGVEHLLGELAAALAYLQSGGYVEYEELRSRELPGLPRLVRVGITAAGADLVDGTTDDPGIDLP